MSRAKYMVLLAALILGPAMACASEEGSIPLKGLPVREKLDSRMDVNFQGMSLSEVMEFFRRRLEIDVVLADKPVTLQLKDVRAQDALAWSLRQAGLQYVLFNGIVLVGDRQYVRAMEPMTLRQYDVADLLVIPSAVRP
jgi:type II secretory pathway component GspD/PulD (secretin)